MGRLIGERLLWAIPTLFAIVLMAFTLMRLTPGGPFDAERALPPEIEANLRAAYGLDKPLPQQFIDYVTGLARGDFGPSFKYKDFAVAELLWKGAPISALIGGLALALAVVAGVALGCIAALRQNTAIDTAVMGFGLLGVAVPNFVVAPLLALLFGVAMGVLPVAGWPGQLSDPGGWRYVVMPVIALALPQVAAVARLTRASMIEQLRANHIRTARAKGLSPWRIVVTHALPGALLPVVSYLGPAAAALLTGSVVVETVFGLPGIGRYFVQGALNRDYTLVLGVVVLYAALLVLFNLLVDLAYGFLDPRIRRR
jgi:oligopeptide transport system permease protein